nr:MAG TPA: helix-turn-helix domain protein [Caudoviricetes sp.]
MSEIGERVSRCIEALGVKRSAFAKAINVTPSHVTKMCAGETNLSDRTISDICKVYSVSEKWLREGIGEMFVERSKREKMADFMKDMFQAAPDDIRVRLINVLAELDWDEWELIADMAQKLADEFAGDKKADP